MRKASMLTRHVFAVMIAGMAMVLMTVPAGAGAIMDKAGAERLFSSANAMYDEGKYSEAAAEYEKIMDGGYESGPLYFNAGNAYFRAGNIGKAVLNYERAARLMPRDADLRTNYGYASAGVKDRVLAKRALWDWGPFRRYSAALTVNEITLIASACFLAVLCLFVIGLVFPAIRRHCAAVSVLAVILLAINIALLTHRVASESGSCVVTVPAANAMYGPFESATKFFSVSEGMHLEILEEKDEWVKVKRADGKTGWLKKGDVEEVRP